MPAADAGDVARYRGLIVAALPHLAGARFEMLGRSTALAALGCDDTVFRLPRTLAAAEALRREAALLDYLRPRVTMPLPQLQIIDGTPPFSLHRKIEGMPLTPQFYRDLDIGRRKAIALRLAGFLAELHALPLPRLTAIGAIPAPPWPGPDAILSGALPLLPKKAHAFARRMLKSYRGLSIAGDELIFGQFGTDGSNIVLDARTGLMSGIHGFSGAGFGARHRDLSYPARVDLDLLLRVLDAYEEVSGVRPDRALALLYASVDRLARIAGASDAPEREAILDWVGAVEAIVPPPPPKPRRRPQPRAEAA